MSPVSSRELRCDGVPEFWFSTVVGIPRPAGPERPDGGFDDVWRRVEVRLATHQGHNRASFGLQCANLCQETVDGSGAEVDQEGQSTARREDVTARTYRCSTRRRRAFSIRTPSWRQSPVGVAQFAASSAWSMQMVLSLKDASVRSAFADAAKPATRSVAVGTDTFAVHTPFPSPQDWRDGWIYFLMLDRFNRSDGKPPVSMPYDKPFGQYQGGTFNGVRERLRYIKDLGAGRNLAVAGAEESAVGPQQLSWIRDPGLPPAGAKIRVGAAEGGGRAARPGRRGPRAGPVT